jgi:hypothetical protein
LTGVDAAIRMLLIPGPAELPAARAALPELALRRPPGVALDLSRDRVVKRSPVPLGAAGFSPDAPQTIK